MTVSLGDHERKAEFEAWISENKTEQILRTWTCEMLSNSGIIRNWKIWGHDKINVKKLKAQGCKNPDANEGVQTIVTRLLNFTQTESNK